MSHYMTALAMKQKGLKPAAKIVLYWLADHHNGETGHCFPSLTRLAEVCEMSKRSVQIQIDALEEAGLISIDKRFREDGQQTSNSFIFNLGAQGGWQNLLGGVAESARGGSRICHPITLEDNLGKEHTPKPPQGAGDFEAFWDAYPRKVGKDAARKAWGKAVKKSKPSEIMAGLKVQLPAIQAADQQFQPHPATWLNQGRWQDEAPKKARSITDAWLNS